MDLSLNEMKERAVSYLEFSAGENKEWHRYDSSVKASLAILSDCMDREGFDNVIERMDKETMDQMIDMWSLIIRRAQKSEGAEI